MLLWSLLYFTVLIFSSLLCAVFIPWLYFALYSLFYESFLHRIHSLTSLCSKFILWLHFALHVLIFYAYFALYSKKPLYSFFVFTFHFFSVLSLHFALYSFFDFTLPYIHSTNPFCTVFSLWLHIVLNSFFDFALHWTHSLASLCTACIDFLCLLRTVFQKTISAPCVCVYLLYVFRFLYFLVQHLVNGYIFRPLKPLKSFLWVLVFVLA
jgi:hypothetical protein